MRPAQQSFAFLMGVVAENDQHGDRRSRRRRRLRLSFQQVWVLPHSWSRPHVPPEFRFHRNRRKAEALWEVQRFLWERSLARRFLVEMTALSEPDLKDLNQRITKELFGRFDPGRAPLRSAISQALRAYRPRLRSRDWVVVQVISEWTFGYHDRNLRALTRIANAQFFEALGWDAKNPASWAWLRSLLNELIKRGVIGRIRSRGKLANVYWLKAVQDRLLLPIDPDVRPPGQDDGELLHQELDNLAAAAEALYEGDRAARQPIYVAGIGVAARERRT